MAIFGKTKTEKKVEEKAPKAKVVKAVKAPKVAKETKAVSATPAVVADRKPVASVILAPHVTEKSSFLAEKNNVYTFKVSKNATKQAVAHSIKKAYNVTPVGVRIVNLAGKQVFVRGKFGFESGFKKAYVCLKKGDKIEIA